MSTPSPTGYYLDMIDLAPTWTTETIALLINKDLILDSTVQLQPNQIRIPGLIHMSRLLQARLEFSSAHQAEACRAQYEGLAVPMTHGYHYYRFDSRHRNPLATRTPISTKSPCLHVQLLPLSTPDLKYRLGISKLHKPQGKLGRFHYHFQLLRDLCHSYGHDRPMQDIKGVPVAMERRESLLRLLQDHCHHDDTRLWPPLCDNRAGVQAGRYLTLREKQSGSFTLEQKAVWEACRLLYHETLGESATPYTALAITFNFTGSPHVDRHDTTVQHVIALGDFEQDGGRLCVDQGDHVVRIDIFNRLGCMDGRNIHWVEGWKGHGRFSIVYYSTNPKHFTPIQSSVRSSEMQDEARILQNEMKNRNEHDS